MSAEESPGPAVPALGHNRPPLARQISDHDGDFAAVTTEFLGEEHGKQAAIMQSLLDEATALMPRSEDGKLLPIADDEQKGKVASLIKRMRDQAKALLAFHGREKQPYLRGGQAVDQYFFGMIDKLARRDRKNRPGAADVLNDMLTDYDQRMLAAEQERRRSAAAEAERVAKLAREEQERTERAASEAQETAERARKPETIAAKEAVVEVRQEQASVAKVNAVITQGRAEAARVDTLAKPADIMRQRHDDGTLTTMATESYAEVEDDALLDKNELWPFIKLEAKEQALRLWAKTKGHTVQMAGAKIGNRPKSSVR